MVESSPLQPPAPTSSSSQQSNADRRNEVFKARPDARVRDFEALAFVNLRII